MKIRFKVALLAVLIGLLGMSETQACSVAFYTGDGSGASSHLTGRTMDLTSELLVMTNSITIYPRNKARNGNTLDRSLLHPVRWTSQYGSLVADKVGEGINEKGLGVYVLYLDKTLYATPDEAKPAISILKLPLYLLDNAATVSECLELIAGVTVVDENLPDQPIPLHLAIRDAHNDMAVVEFINAGTETSPQPKTVVYHGPECDVLTNEPNFDVQLEYYSQFAPGDKALPGDFNAMDRFVRLKMFKKTLKAGTGEWEMVANIFSLMSAVHCMPGTVDYSGKEDKGHEQWPNIWTSVTDPDNMKYYMKFRESPNTFWVDLKKINFETLTKTGTLKTNNHKLAGRVNHKFKWH